MHRLRRRQHLNRLPRLELQSQQSECGVVCAAALLALAGARVRLSDLRRQAGDTGRGLSVRQVRDILRRCGGTSEVIAFDTDRIEALPEPAILLLNRGHFVVLGRRERDQLSVFYPEHGWTKVAFDVLKGQMTAFAVILGEVNSDRLPTRIGNTRPPVVSAALKAIPPKQFAIYGLTLVAAQLMVLALPALTGSLVDASGASSQAGSFGPAAVIYALVSFAAGLVMTGGHYFSQMIAKRVGVSLGRSSIEALKQKRPRWFEALPVDGVRNAIGAVDAISRLVHTSVATSIASLTSLVVAAIAIVCVSPWMVLLSIPLIIATALIDVVAEARQTEASVRLFETAQNKTRFVGDALSQFPMFARMDRLSALEARYMHVVEAAVSTEAALNVRRSVVTSATSLVRAIDLLIFSFASSILMKSGAISLGEFVAAGAYKVALTQGIGALIQLRAQYRGIAPALAQSTDLYSPDHPTEVPHPHDAPNGCVAVLRGVDFSYDRFSAPILTDLNLEVRVGEFVVIAGPSGTGKTTIAKLIAGLETPNAGWVSVMGGRAQLGMAGVSLVLQTDRLIDGSIRDNVTLLEPNIDDNAVFEALARVRLDTFVRELPMGLATVVNEGRGGLSAGQRQRILLARAVLAPPRLLVLDEATSNIDVALEAEVLFALRATGATIILISHRPEAWSGADRILDLIDGRLLVRVPGGIEGASLATDGVMGPES